MSVTVLVKFTLDTDLPEQIVRNIIEGMLGTEIKGQTLSVDVEDVKVFRCNTLHQHSWPDPDKPHPF